MDKRVQKTKQAIQKSLLDLLAEKDFLQITVTDIANRAMINRKTFYYHYASPHEVLLDFEQALAHELEEAVQPDTTLVELINLLNQILLRHHAFFLEMVKKNTSFFFLEQCEEILYQFFLHHFQPREGLSQTEFELALQFSAAGILSLYIKWLQDQKSSNISQLSHGIEKILATFLPLYTKNFQPR